MLITPRDGGDNLNPVPIFEPGLHPIGITDVLVIDVNIDEIPDAAFFFIQILLQFRKPAAKICQNLFYIFSVLIKLILIIGKLPQRGRHLNHDRHFELL